MIGKNCLKPGLAALLIAVAVGLLPGVGEAATLKLPIHVAESTWRTLDQRKDPRLQNRLEQALRRENLWQALICEKKMAVGLVDLANPARPRFAQINGETMMYAASLPKIAILLAAFQGFHDGSLKETPQMRADLIEMIRRSDNFAASKVVGRIGLEKIERLIQEPRYRFYDKQQGGGIWVGGYFARGGEQNPEPLKNLVQAATVYQVCRFYYLLAYGRLVSPASSQQMLKIMAFPDLHDKFVSILEKEVPPNYLFRKSGEFGIWHSDSVLVWGGARRRYILVGMVESRQGEQILRNLVPTAERILKGY